MKRFELDGASTVQSPLGFKVGLMRFFGGGKRTKVNVPAVSLDGRLPLAMVFSSTHKPGSRIASYASLVFAVLRRCYVPEIAKPVVGRNPVDVVKIASRPRTMHVKPDQSMLCVLPAADRDPSVKLRRGGIPSTIARLGEMVSVDAPCENAGFRVVIEKLFETLLRQGRIAASHEAVLSLIGERPNSVRSGFGPRYFSMGGA